MSLIESSFEQLASTQESANHQMGPRFVPARSIPVPSTVSPLLQSAIAAPYRVPAWNADPVDMTGWKALINDLGAQTTTSTREFEKHLGVTREDVVINGVKAFLLTPPVVSPENRNRLLINAHGGGYLYNPGEAGAMESVSMAAYGGHQGCLCGLPDAARSPVPRWPGRLHESVEGDCRDKRSEKAGALRQLRRCRHGACNDLAGQRRRPTVTGCARYRNAMGGSDRDWRHI
jgi:hypothetical protein